MNYRFAHPHRFVNRLDVTAGIGEHWQQRQAVVLLDHLDILALLIILDRVVLASTGL